MDYHDNHTHGHSLADDLPLIDAMIARRRALKWFVGAGSAALVAGCGGSGAGDVDVIAGAAATATPTPTPTPTATSGPLATATACIADPTETGGPYPADGTNTSGGASSNVLTVNGIVRSDIRASFISTTTVATGVQMTLTLTLVDVNASCAPLAGFAIYLWQCDRNGHYSLYSGATAESYLRGVQVTDANGQVSFTTIFPACYDGRWPHLHFEIFSSIGNALGGRYAVLTSQLALPADWCATVFADTSTYPSSSGNFARVSLASDMVFGDNSDAQLAQQTPAVTGAVATGLVATAVIGIAR